MHGISKKQVPYWAHTRRLTSPATLTAVSCEALLCGRARLPQHPVTWLPGPQRRCRPLVLRFNVWSGAESSSAERSTRLTAAAADAARAHVTSLLAEAGHATAGLGLRRRHNTVHKVHAIVLSGCILRLAPLTGFVVQLPARSAYRPRVPARRFSRCSRFAAAALSRRCMAIFAITITGLV